MHTLIYPHSETVVAQPLRARSTTKYTQRVAEGWGAQQAVRGGIGHQFDQATRVASGQGARHETNGEDAPEQPW